MRGILLSIRYALVPAGSRREKVYHTLRVLLLVTRLYGVGVMVTQLKSTIQMYWRRSMKGGSFSQANYNYQVWIGKNEPTKRELQNQHWQIDQFAYRPLISFITPVYNPGIDVLRDTLNAVLAQTYHKWVFCLANASSNPKIAALLDEFSAHDERIRVVHLPENLGISGNTNQALKLANGDFIALLDHDDLVSPEMLYQVVNVLNEKSDLDVVYFDEDKISEDGLERSDPWFKPSRWSPDLLLSTNYLMHSVIRRQLVLDLNGFDTKMDGAQDWDLALRLIERTRKIHHIPKVFYHWRRVAGSAARDANAKPWAFTAQEHCIRTHLQRLGIEGAQVSFPRLGTLRILWPTQNVQVAIIIPTKDNLEILQACLDSIFEKTTYLNYEVILVDNQSDDPDVEVYYQKLEQHPRVRLLYYPHPYNYHAINNWAAYQVDADVLVFLNNDTEVIDPAWLDDLVGWALRPEVGVVGAKLLRPNGKIQHAGMIVGLMGHASHIFEDCDDHVYTHFGSVDWYRDYQAVTGACMAVRRNIFEELQGFDETYIVGYGDIDFCLRSIDAGYRVVYTPFAVLLHYEGGTRGLTLPPSDVLRASVKMFPAMEQGDGYFNPNLSYSSRQPVVRHLQEEPRGERLVRIMREFGLIGAGMGMTEWQDTLLSIPSQILSVDVPRNLIRGQSFSRLLIVTHELTRSGAPIILWMLAKYLKQHGHAVQVISPTDGPLKDDFLQQDIPVTVVPRLLEDARVSIPFLDDIQMVLCNTILTWRVVYAARAFARPCLWWVHESDFGVKLAAKNRSIGRAFEAATQVVFPSRTTKLQYQQFSRYNNLSALLTGFDVNTTITVDEPLFERNDHDLHLVCVATLEPRKGQDILLDAMADLPADVAAHTHCYLIGRTNIDTVFSYKIRWRSWWMKNIHLIGELPNDRVKQYLRQACVFVLSSRDEALPLALIEAMALRKPIISTDAGGISEIIRSGQNGYVVDVEDSHALAECITTLYRQPELLHHLGQQAQKDYQAFHTIAHFGEQMLQLLQDTYTHSIKI